MSYIASLLKAGKVTYMLGAAAAGVVDQTPATPLDMTGYDSVAVLALTGDCTSGSVQELKVFGVATSAVTGGTEQTSSTATFTSASATDGDNKVLIVDVTRWNPTLRYMYPTWVIDTQNCVSNGILAIQYNAKDLPVTQSSSVIASGVVVAG